MKHAPGANAAQARMLEVRVRPRSAVQRLEGPDAEGVWHAWLKSPPLEGRANEELIALFCSAPLRIRSKYSRVWA